MRFQAKGKPVRIKKTHEIKSRRPDPMQPDPGSGALLHGGGDVINFIVDARMIDGVIGLVAVEAAIVVAVRVMLGRGPELAPFISNLCAGAFLLLATRNALAGESSYWISACLVAALVAHLLDLAGRWPAPHPR